MIGRILLYIRREFSEYGLCGKHVSAVLYCLSEFESLVLRPKQHNLFRRLYLRIKGVRFGRHCFIGNGLRLYKPPSHHLEFGENLCIGENAGIFVHSIIQIGSSFLAAPGLTINNGTHDLELMTPSALPISIGDRVWCGVNVTIIAGAKIGDDCVIGANSLVNSDIPSNSLAYGTPAKVVRTLHKMGDKTNIWNAYNENA